MKGMIIIQVYLAVVNNDTGLVDGDVGTFKCASGSTSFTVGGSQAAERNSSAFSSGTTCTFTATPASGYEFVQAEIYFENTIYKTTKYSSSFTYTLNANSRVDVTAFFQETSDGGSSGDDEEEEDVEFYYKSYDLTKGVYIDSEKTTTSSSITRPSTHVNNGYTYLGYVYHTSFSKCLSQGEDYDFDGDETTCNTNSKYPYIIFFYEKNIVTYTISYNANGGSGAPTSQSYDEGNSITLSSTTPTKAGYNFLGWSTSSIATSATYSAGSTYTLSGNYTLYAVWSPKTYKISYNANGGSGTISSQIKTYGTNLILQSSGFTRTGYTLSKWNTASDGTGTSYNLGAAFSDPNTNCTDITLYAIWTVNSYIISYDANGGSGAPNNDSYNYNSTASINTTTIPTKTGWTFKGWATTSNTTTPTYKVNITNTMTMPAYNVKLYAVWWPEFSWNKENKEYANILIGYLNTYIGSNIQEISSDTSLLYLTSKYNEMANAVKALTINPGVIIAQEQFEALSNAYNNY